MRSLARDPVRPKTRKKNHLLHLARQELGAGLVTNEASGKLSDQAYISILQALFDGRIPLGAFVSQKQLVATLGFPIQPLRDALRVLHAEGVLTVLPRSGIQFLRADSSLVRSIYQLRLMVEVPSVRVFAKTNDPVLIDKLRARHESLIDRIDTKGLTSAIREQLIVLDDQLHAAFISVLENALVEAIARRLDNYVAIIHLKYKIEAAVAMQTLQEHLEILEACRNHSSDRAEAALTAHLQAALQRILAFHERNAAAAGPGGSGLTLCADPE